LSFSNSNFDETMQSSLGTNTMAITLETDLNKRYSFHGNYVESVWLAINCFSASSKEI